MAGLTSSQKEKGCLALQSINSRSRVRKKRRDVTNLRKVLRDKGKSGVEFRRFETGRGVAPDLWGEVRKKELQSIEQELGA